MTGRMTPLHACRALVTGRMTPLHLCRELVVGRMTPLHACRSTCSPGTRDASVSVSRPGSACARLCTALHDSACWLVGNGACSQREREKHTALQGEALAVGTASAGWGPRACWPARHTATGTVYCHWYSRAHVGQPGMLVRVHKQVEDREIAGGGSLRRPRRLQPLAAAQSPQQLHREALKRRGGGRDARPQLRAGRPCRPRHELKRGGVCQQVELVPLQPALPVQHAVDADAGEGQPRALRPAARLRVLGVHVPPGDPHRVAAASVMQQRSAARCLCCYEGGEVALLEVREDTVPVRGEELVERRRGGREREREAQPREEGGHRPQRRTRKKMPTASACLCSPRRAVLPSLPWVVCFLSFFCSPKKDECRGTYLLQGPLGRSKPDLPTRIMWVNHSSERDF